MGAGDFDNAGKFDVSAEIDTLEALAESGSEVLGAEGK